MSFDTVLFTEDENQALTRPQEAFLWRSGIPREQSRTETQAKQASQRQPRTPHSPQPMSPSTGRKEAQQHVGVITVEW